MARHLSIEPLDFDRRTCGHHGKPKSFSRRLLAALALLAPLTSDATVNLAWDPVDDDRVAVYEVWYGTESTNYSESLDTVETTATIDGLAPGTDYYFAVRACEADRAQCSDFSSEVSTSTAPSNTPPDAVNDTATVLEDSANNAIDVLANDTDVDGHSLSVTGASASNGTVSVNSNGTLRYSPSANFNGSDTLSYSISDGAGGTDSATVTVSVTAVNDAPRAENDTATLLEDSGKTLNVLSNDSDVDGDSLSVTGASAGHGTVSINSNGTLRYSPSLNFNGSDTLAYTVSDGAGGTDTAIVAISVTAVNDAPVAMDDSATVAEDSSANTLSVLANDTDVDGHTLSVTGASAGNGTVSVNGNGTLSYSPSADFNGTDTLSYSISDGAGATDSATVTVSVTAVNDAPVATDDSATVAEDSIANTLSVLANDTDVDGDSLSVSGASAGNGTVSVNTDGTLSYSPLADFYGTDTLTYTVSDGAEGTDSAAVTVSVTAINDAPVAMDDSATVEADSTGNVLAVLANDSDVDGDVLTVAAATAANGTVSVNTDGTLSYSPTPDFVGTESLSYEIRDAAGASASATVTVEVTAVNEPPIASFTVNKTSGNAPLLVSFTDTSSGEITERNWQFGDGGTATDASIVTHSYTEPGTYSIQLSVTGPGGGDTYTLTDAIVVLDDDTTTDDPDGNDDPHATPPVIEVGEISVSDQWQWVDFQNDFTDPVVVVKPLGGADSDPAEIRIETIEKTRFRVRIEEWDYLDGTHAIEKASYLVVERGIHLLDDGTWIEADSIETGSTDAFAEVDFTAPFSEAPVLVSSVTSSNESDTVTVRLRNIGTDSFEILLQEQEANLDVHAAEIIDFVAWEPSTGTLDGRPYEVARTADAVRHEPFAITYATAFDSPPAFVADMQSTDGRDTATLRWDLKTETGIEVWVDEETSHDTEVNHTTETVGYMAFGNSGNAEIEIIVDNQDPNTEQFGNWTWKTSSGADPWAGESVYNNSGSVFRWLPAIPQNGNYQVYAWWTYHGNRSNNVPYRIGHDGGVSTVTVNQRDQASAGQWVLLGEYPFTAGTGYVEVSSENGQASADAVRLVRSGGGGGVANVEVIVDNQDADTEQTGTWKASSGADPWAGESTYNNSGSVFRWLPVIPQNGTYQVYAWWTYHNNRSSNVPYRIGHDGGVSTVTVNQHDQALAGQWVLLGEYPFTAGTGYVEVSSENGQASADAVRLVQSGGN